MKKTKLYFPRVNNLGGDQWNLMLFFFLLHLCKGISVTYLCHTASNTTTRTQLSEQPCFLSFINADIFNKGQKISNKYYKKSISKKKKSFKTFKILPKKAF